ncbi:MAG: alkaline phosphatase family protein [Acidimicrobiales bacterium]
MAQVLTIGLDGATWDLLVPMAQAGRLPHLAKLMARGSWGDLRSTVPALTLPAWSSCITGRNPGGHGVFAFRRQSTADYGPGRLANAADLRAPTVWDLAGQGGKRVGVVNVPPSYPLRPVPGFIVGCLLTPPGAPFTAPLEVAGELGPYRIDVPAPRDLRRDAPDFESRALGYLEALREQTVWRGEAVARVVAQRPVDLLMVVFYGPDRVQHFFWADVKEGKGGPIHAAALAVYSAMDDAVGRLVRAAGEDATVLVVSDHGFGDRPERAVHVNRWLADRGLLTRYPLWTLRRKVIRRLFPARWRAHYDTIDHIMVDRRRSRAWAGTIEPRTIGIWVHRRDQYPLGTVSPGPEYEAIRDAIRTGLTALRDEADRPVFTTVARREDLYHGPFVEEAPDLVAVCTKPFGGVFNSLGRDLRAKTLFSPYTEAGYSGTHDPAGIYLFAGPLIRARGRGGELPIEAIAPTTLHLLGLPVPKSFEAPVCTEVLEPDFLARQPIRIVEDEQGETDRGDGGWQSEGDETLIADHLRALGYLE